MTSRAPAWAGAAILVAALGACKDTEPKDNAPQTEGKDTEAPAQQPPAPDRRATASAAKDQLMAQLSGRLMEVMKAAVRVCSTEAPTLAAEVSKRLGVKIGRTSARLRNSKNTPPEWSRAVVDEGKKAAQFVDLPGGGLGAMFPIVLQDKCETCHGDPEKIDPAVREVLAELYPDDKATGFSTGDLRGWFWVEVPPS
jgi:hypothetical protein